MRRKLRTALKRRASEQGFALPIALGMGLVMVLVGTTMVLRSQDDQVTASAQKATNRGLSAAETGITQYQSLINRNRIIAMYPRTGTFSWTSAASIPGINSTCGGGASGVTAAATTDWKNVESGDATQGQYRLVDYTYPTPGVPGANGTLTVEGRVNQSGSGNAATSTSSTATTKLVVNVPVQAGSLNTIVPGLWVKNSAITDMGSDKINGNLLINSCPPAASATTANLKDPTTQKVIANPVSFPDTPALPASYYTLTESPFGKTFPRPAIPAVPAVPATKKKPAVPEIPEVPGDVPGADGYYHYLISDLVGNGNDEITISPSKKVIFYVKGNIDLSGNPDLNKTSGNTPDQLQIYGNTYTSLSTTKYGCVPGTTLGSSCPTLTAHLNGTGTMRAFIHAPDATGSVNGGGNTNGNFVGSMWLKDWDASSGNSKIKIDASGDYSNYLGAQNIILPPLTSSTSSWQRQEVTP